MITSSKNPIVQRVAKLRQKKNRDRQNEFLIEGQKEITHAIAAKLDIETLIHCPQIVNSDTVKKIIRPAKKMPQIIEVAQHLYEKIACRQNVQGTIAIAGKPKNDIQQLKLPENPLILIAAGIEKPGNIGALVRNADAAGVDAMIAVDDHGTDLYNPNVVRASMGALFTVKTFTLTAEKTVEFLKQNNITLITAQPNGKRLYNEIDYTKPVALAVGREDRGLSDKWQTTPNNCVKIPMTGQMDSLNVSCAAAIVLYEALRQRQIG